MVWHLLTPNYMAPPYTPDLMAKFPDFMAPPSWLPLTSDLTADEVVLLPPFKPHGCCMARFLVTGLLMAACTYFKC